MPTMSMSRMRELDDRLAELGIKASDLVEQFVCSSGPGGQHVNRSATAVKLRHEPSGLETRAEGERSQLQNRVAAREQLIARIESARAAEALARQAAREKARRRRRRRPAHLKARILRGKRRRGQLKKNRGRVDEEDEL